MTITDRWLLPDGVREILPEQAARVENLRRRLLDTYASWGYEFVIPPLVEFTESLLVSANRDLDLQTFKVTDQLSGRMMGIRADITPQTARIDAHSLNRDNTPTRLCYADTVLHSVPANPWASRTPIQVGCELYGVANLAADIEVISLMLESLRIARLEHITLDLGHVAIFNSLAAQANLGHEQAEDLLDLLQRKATDDIASFVKAHIHDKTTATQILALPALCGGRDILAAGRKLFAKLPAAITAIDELEKVADCIGERMPDTALYFDLGELRGYHYHTGIVFAAYVPGCGQAIANGGRYDHVGEIFGRARPATGFNADIITLVTLGKSVRANPANAIFAIENDDNAQWHAIQSLRARGERVICGDSSSDPVALGCDRRLLLKDKQYITETI